MSLWRTTNASQAAVLPCVGGLRDEETVISYLKLV